MKQKIIKPINRKRSKTLQKKFHKEAKEHEFSRDFDRIMKNINSSQLVCIESEIDKNKDVEIDKVSYDKLAIKFKVFDENYYDLDVEKQKEIDQLNTTDH